MSYDIDACKRLLIALGMVRSLEYRVAYRRYLGSPTKANKAQVKYWGDMLKDPFTNCTDADLRTIQRQVEAGRNKDFKYRPEDIL